ncbi:MAG: hypothetical protein ACRDLN_01085 [Solirubrobacteraceae bacterium]
MSAKRTARLSGEEMRALKFASHRQLSRWTGKPGLSPGQHAQRAALKSAVQVLQDKAFAHGCELRAGGAEEDA